MTPGYAEMTNYDTWLCREDCNRGDYKYYAGMLIMMAGYAGITVCVCVCVCVCGWVCTQG